MRDTIVDSIADVLRKCEWVIAMEMENEDRSEEETFRTAHKKLLEYCDEDLLNDSVDRYEEVWSEQFKEFFNQDP